MLTIDQHGAIYVPSNISSPRPNPLSNDRGRAPETEAQTVDLSSSSAKQRPVTYSKPLGQAVQPSATVSNTERELTPISSDRKALVASKAFLDVAHFDGGVQLVDAYA